eukprot:1141296-Pelagomonas_calceolata.AAC.5
MLSVPYLTNDGHEPCRRGRISLSELRDLKNVQMGQGKGGEMLRRLSAASNACTWAGLLLTATAKLIDMATMIWYRAVLPAVP